MYKRSYQVIHQGNSCEGLWGTPRLLYCIGTLYRYRSQSSLCDYQNRRLVVVTKLATQFVYPMTVSVSRPHISKPPHFEDPIYFEKNVDIGGLIINVYFKRFRVRKGRALILDPNVCCTTSRMNQSILRILISGDHR